MKISVLPLLFFVLFFNNNKLFAQTTIQDYNYVSKGLLDDLNMGRDVKDGFKLISTGISGQVNQSNGSWHKAEIYYFNRSSNGRTQAFAIACTDQKGNKRFMCIPVNGSSSKIWDITFTDLNSTGCEWHSVFMWAFAKLIANKLS